MIKRRTRHVYGHRIPPPRLTFGAVGLGFVFIGLPILLIGLALDFAVLGLFGICTGLVCAF